MTRRADLPLWFAAAFVGACAMALLFAFQSVRAGGPSVALYDAAGGQLVAVGGEACGIQAKGEGFTGASVDSEVLLADGKALASFHDAVTDGVWRGQPYFPIFLGSLSLQWRSDDGYGGVLPFVNVCAARPATPTPTPPLATVRPTLPATDTE